MARGAMIALSRILHDKLPIGALHERALMSKLRVRKLMRREQRRQAIAKLVERRRFFRETDVDAPGDIFETDGLQPDAAWIKRRLHPAGGLQRAVQPVCPLMVRANKARLASMACFADLRPPVPTGVVKGLQRSIMVADDHDRRACDRCREVTARRRQLTFKAHENPAA